MKVYHGTSFENACKILSQELWAFPVELSLKSEYDIRNKLNQKDYIHNDRFMYSDIHFTTSLPHAKSYANQNKKPVVLFFDMNLSSPCIDFVIDTPIETSKIKCIDSWLNGLYVPLCNVLYRKKSKYGYSIILNKNYSPEIKEYTK
jgi:hypothetical protein